MAALSVYSFTRLSSLVFIPTTRNRSRIQTINRNRSSDSLKTNANAYNCRN